MIADIFFLVLTAVLLILTIALWCQSIYRLLTYKSVAGRVTGYRQDEDCYFAKVEFVAESGETVTATCDSGCGAKQYAIDAGIRVLYKPSDPSVAMIRSVSHMWFAPILMSAIAGVFLFGTIRDWAKYFS